MCRAILKMVNIVAIVMLLLSASGCYASGIEQIGNTITVKRGGDFQAALNRARAGDTITLEAGAVFKGSFKLPNGNHRDFITIRSSASDTQLPAPGTRIDPVKYASVLPKIEASVKGEPAISALNGAHHFRFVAVEFGPTIGGLYNIIQLGDGEESRVEDIPHHIEFDRVYIHGSSLYGQRRGIAANGKFISIKNSHISDIKQKGEESQAIAVWAGDGPVEIVNNYLEAAGENILFGGAGSVLNLVPTDCVVRDNHLNKPVEWRAERWGVKNLFEIKNGRRIRVENNLMTNNWGMAQDGYAVLFTTRTDSGDAAIIEDIEFIGNVVRGSGGGVNILGEEARGGHKLRIHNNLFDDIDGRKWNGDGHFMKSNAWDGLVITNNTIIQSGNISNAYGRPITGFIFRNNIVFENSYGFAGDSMSPGRASIEKFFPKGEVRNNIIVGGTPESYSEKNFYPNSIRLVGFVDPAKGDYRLRVDSPYMGKGLSGDSIGANIALDKVGRSDH